MKKFLWPGVLVAAAVAVACGGSDHGTFYNGAGGSTSMAGRPGHAGSSGSGGDTSIGEGGAAGATPVNSLAPVVQITSPTEVTDPNTGKLLVDSDVTVTCNVTKSKAADAAPVLTSSIKIQLFGSDGKQIGMDGVVQSSGSTGDYTSKFVLTDVPSGAVSFSCTASDSATSPNVATDTVKTFVDHGPVVNLIDPKPSSAHPLMPDLDFSISALPSPLAASDPGAEVASVQLLVDDVDIKGISKAGVAGMPGYYQMPIALSDNSLFYPAPSGDIPVRIIATNKRGTVNAGGVYSISIDSTGPVIHITSPSLNTFVGGKVTLEMTIDDAPAGVDVSTILLTLNSKKIPFDLKTGWSQKGTTDVFDYTFDTRDYPSTLIQLSVNVVASDLAANVSNGDSGIYFIDNVAPIVDMNPPEVQEERNPTNSPQCSAFFDPLGTDAVDDLDTIPDVNMFRALVWDVGNSAPGQSVLYFSSIAKTPDAVQLYFQPDPSKKLVNHQQDTGSAPMSGGICNAITDKTLPFLNLVAITPQGDPYFPSNAPTVPGCGKGSDDKPPQTQCGGVSTLSRVIKHDLASSTPDIPVVYGVMHDSTQCDGAQFDITNDVKQNGWFCAAVVATDATGNQAVSRPLRLCLNSKQYDPAPCPLPAPDCDDSCTAPIPFTQTLVVRQ